MTYYDHATAIACKLDRWSEERWPQSFERELIARDRRSSPLFAQKRTIFRRFLAQLKRENPEGGTGSRERRSENAVA